MIRVIFNNHQLFIHLYDYEWVIYFYYKNFDLNLKLDYYLMHKYLEVIWIRDHK